MVADIHVLLFITFSNSPCYLRLCYSFIILNPAANLRNQYCADVKATLTMKTKSASEEIGFASSRRW